MSARHGVMKTSLSPSEVAHAWFQRVWNDRDDAAVDEMLNPQGSIVGISARDATALTGPAEFRAFRDAIFSILPDIRVEVSKVITDGDWVAVRFTCAGTHTGDGLGMKASGRSVAFSSMGMGRVQNGQWVEGWNLVDFISLERQVGGTLVFG